MPSSVLSSENSKLRRVRDPRHLDHGEELPGGRRRRRGRNLLLRRNCVKGVGAGEWGTSRFIPNRVASGSGSSTRWAPKSMVLVVGAALGRRCPAGSGPFGGVGCGR